MFKATQFLKKGAFCASREKCSAVVKSSYATLLFLPLQNFSLFIDKLKDTKGFIHFKKKIVEEDKMLENLVTARRLICTGYTFQPIDQKEQWVIR